MPLKIAFLGTPAAAVPSLEAVIQSSHAVSAVVTAPDRPKGRGMNVVPSPVKQAAELAGIPVLQPPTLKKSEHQEELAAVEADVFVVVAYGFILPKAVLEMARFGCINVHFSLLPKLRGAGPVQWALIEGHDVSGVTIMQLDEGMDTGPIIDVREETIRPDDDAATLEARLAVAGAELLVEVLGRLEKGKIEPRPQDDSGATYAPKISSEDARIDWSLPAEAIASRVRGMNPRPGAWTTLNDKRIKLRRVSTTEEASVGPPGTITIEKNALLASTGSTMVQLESVQPEGKAPMPGADFARGIRQEDGRRLT